MKKYYGVDFEQKRRELLESETAKKVIDEIISKADEAIDKTYSAIKMSEYMLYFETGDRRKFERNYFERKNDCSYISIAYWLTEDEKYRKPLIDLVFMICDEFTWCLPAHVAVFGENPSVQSMIEVVDLFQAETARLLTDIIVAVGDKLPYYVKERVAYELKRRIFEPMKKYDFYWKKCDNNWAAVCAGGCGVALLHFGDEEDIKIILPMLYDTMECFLSGFGNDGCCMEGYSYWNYGFGYFVIFARMILDYTNGEINYFTRDKVKNIALYPQRVRMSYDKNVSFSDGGATFTFSIGLISYLKEIYGDEFNCPDISLGIANGNVFSFKELLWFDIDYKNDEQELRSHYFDDAQWYINKKKKFSFAAKGGYNDEPHNHNDIGSFMIVTKNGDIPLADFGAAVYRRETFNNDLRYTLLNNSSRGHSVPVINDEYQVFGREYKAENVVVGENRFSLELQGAYENGLISKIYRSFEVKEESVILKDEFVYSDKTESIKERMVTWTKPETGNGYVDLKTARVIYDGSRYNVVVSEDSYRNHLDTEDIAVYMIDYVPVNGRETEFECEILVKEN